MLLCKVEACFERDGSGRGGVGRISAENHKIAFLTRHYSLLGAFQEKSTDRIRDLYTHMLQTKNQPPTIILSF